jgi:hypothetical protein
MFFTIYAFKARDIQKAREKMKRRSSLNPNGTLTFLGRI